MLVASKFNKKWPSIAFSKCELSESAAIMVVVATALGETLHRSPRNAQSFRIKRRAFRLVPPDGGLLVGLFSWHQKRFQPSPRPTQIR